MLNKDQILTLCKVLVALAWSDDEVHPKEMQLVYNLLLSRPDITEEDHLLIKLYGEYQLSDLEVKNLINTFRKEFKIKQEIEIAFTWIKRLVEADGKLVELERILYSELKKAIKTNTATKEKGLGAFFKASLSKASFLVQISMGRDRHLEHYIKNPIHFRLKRLLQSADVSVDIDNDMIKKVCLASTLLFQVARADNKLTNREVKKIIKLLDSSMKVPIDVLHGIVREAIRLEDELFDLKRICKHFVEKTDSEERKGFVAILCDMAVSDRKYEVDESSKIIEIATALGVSEEVVNDQIRMRTDELFLEPKF